MPLSFYALLAMLPCTFCAHYFIHLMVPIRRPVLYASLSTLADSIVWAVNHILAPQISVAFDLLIYAADLILMFCFVPRKKMPMFFLVYILLCAVQIIATVLALAGLSVLLHVSPDRVMSPDSIIYPIGCLLCTILAIVMMDLFVRLLRRILPPLREKRILIACSCLFFCQILLVYIIVNLYVYGKDLVGGVLTLSIASVLYIAAGIAFLRGYQSMHRMDLDAMTARQAQQQLELQTGYYHQLQHNIIQINQVRHDLSNQLQAAYYLLEQGEQEQVRRQLDLLHHQIRDKVGTKYCPNLIVDAILNEKASQCSACGIPLCLSVFLPEDLPIETTHLCSVFSNILDNSIQATSATKKPYGTIELSADVHGSFVCIECTNPARSIRRTEQRDLLRTHGLGLEILQNLASQYHGSLNTHMEDGKFYLKLLLALSDAPSPASAAGQHADSC